MEAYCFKCRTKREIKDPQQVTLRNGKPATKGMCPVCGTLFIGLGRDRKVKGRLENSASVIPRAIVAHF